MMTWLIVIEYLCHKWQWICFLCRNCNPVLFLLKIYHQSNTTSGTRTDYPSGAPSVLCGVRVTHSLSFLCSVMCIIHACVFVTTGILITTGTNSLPAVINTYLYSVSLTYDDIQLQKSILVQPTKKWNRQTEIIYSPMFVRDEFL
jgi:hypothetical protein